MSARERQSEILAAALRDGKPVRRLPPGPVPDRPLIDAYHQGTGYHGRCKCGQPLTMTDDQGHRYARCGCGGMTR